jgi:hypothetical protein
VGAAWVKKAEDAHHEHMEHVKHENGGQKPETAAYSYLNKRDKPFPWGMNSLFYNAEVRSLSSVNFLKTGPLIVVSGPERHGEERRGVVVW